MNINYLNYLKEKKDLLPVVLLGFSAILGILIVFKLAGFLVASASAEGIVEKAVAQNKAGAKDADKYFAESKTLAEQLKKNNLFAPPPPKENPVKQVEGIMGNEVFINGNWHKVGDRIADAQIVSIGPASVKVAWDGSEKEFYPIMSSSSEGSGRPGSDSEAGRGEGGGRPGRAEMVVVRSDGGASGRGGTGGFGQMGGRMGNVSEQDRERMRSEMQAMRERMMNMSPEERDRMREEMRQRFAGGASGGGRGFGGSSGGSGGGRGGRGGRGQ
jgi:hypothetical protein